MKGILKSKKLVKVIAGVGLSLSLVLGSSILYPIIRENGIFQRKNDISAIELTENQTAIDYAQKYNVADYITKDEQGNFVRFEAMKGVPIDIIVDENSMWCMTDDVKQSIKDAVDAYNRIFSYINPEYQFRYITKEEYDKNPTNNPFIFFTTQLRLKNSKGEVRAAAAPANPEMSKYNNGSIDSSSTIIISSTGTVSLNVEELQDVLHHEMAHVLGFLQHIDDVYSIMYPTSNNETVKSNHFSKDVLLTLVSLYYNPETNPRNLSEVLDFIDKEDAIRHQEINNYLAENPKAEEKSKLDKYEENPKAEEKSKLDKYEEKQKEEAKNNFDKYLGNLKQYAKNNDLKRDNVDYIIGKSFSYTNTFGQTMCFTFNENYTYSLEVSKATDSIQLTGTYKIENNTIVANGEYFTVKDFKYEKTTNATSYFSLLSNGECVFATSSNNFVIEFGLQEDLVNSLTN